MLRFNLVMCAFFQLHALPNTLHVAKLNPRREQLLKGEALLFFAVFCLDIPSMVATDRLGSCR